MMIKKVGLIMGPLIAICLGVLQPFSGLDASGQATIGIGIWMAIWWATETIPIPVTALIPIVLFPALEISTLKKTTFLYGHPLIFLFLGGFMLAIALEKWKLHRRIALLLLSKASSSVPSIILMFMLVSAGLSMWVTNTATTMMLVPIALSVIDLIAGKDHHRLSLALLLAIAYSASIGGMATLIGTVPNTIMAGFISEQADIQISFLGWMKIGLPLVVVLLPVVWLLLTRVLFKLKDRKVDSGKDHIRKLLHELGSIKTEEKRTLMIFMLTAVLWIFKTPLNSSVLPFQISDTGIAVFAAILLFIVPASQNGALLVWEDTKRMPWSLLLMFGGGLALASAFEANGVSQWIGEIVGQQKGVSPILIVVMITALTIFVTEMTSNTATTSTFIPIIFPIAKALEIDPMLLLFPTTFAASCAFMLPVATPPNGIVFGTNRIPIKEMMRAGFWLNLVAIFVITVLCYVMLT